LVSLTIISQLDELDEFSDIGVAAIALISKARKIKLKVVSKEKIKQTGLIKFMISQPKTYNLKLKLLTQFKSKICLNNSGEIL
jgi:hypothetical protein